MRYNLTERMQKLDILSHRLRHPGDRLRQKADRLGQLGIRLTNSITRILEQRRTHLERCAQNLELLAPQQVLKRGYSLVHDSAGSIVRNSAILQAGDNISVTFAQGSANASIFQIKP